MEPRRLRARWPSLVLILVLGLVLVVELGAIGTSPYRASPSILGSHPGGSPLGGASSGLRPAASTIDTVIATISGVSSPTTGTFDPANGYVYLPDTTLGLDSGNNGTNLTILDGGTNTVAAVASLGVNAYYETPTYVPSNQELYVADQNGSVGVNNVTAYSGTDHVKANIDTGNESTPTTPVYDPVNKYLYVSDQNTASLFALNNNVSVINTATNKLVTQIGVGYGPDPGVYDPADGDVYVPNFNFLSGTNLSIINATSDTVIDTISGLSSPITPVYNPVNQEVYVPDGGLNSSNLTILKGTTVVKTIEFNTANSGDLMTPVVDSANGDVFVTLITTGGMAVLSPSNTVVTTISIGNQNSFSNRPSTYDPVNGEVYAPGYSFFGETGGVFAINGTTNTVTTLIDVGGAPQTPVFDPTNDELFVPNEDTNNVSVIAAGPIPPGGGGGGGGGGGTSSSGSTLSPLLLYGVLAGVAIVVVVVVAVLVVKLRPHGPKGGSSAVPPPPPGAGGETVSGPGAPAPPYPGSWTPPPPPPPPPPPGAWPPPPPPP
ncbi:MAG: YncE family protein [Thermoplasmata archaeon]